MVTSLSGSLFRSDWFYLWMALINFYRYNFFNNKIPNSESRKNHRTYVPISQPFDLAQKTFRSKSWNVQNVLRFIVFFSLMGPIKWVNHFGLIAKLVKITKVQNHLIISRNQHFDERFQDLQLFHWNQIMWWTEKIRVAYERVKLDF